MSPDRPGISFERAVALVQSQFDSNSAVTHDEVLVDRLGQRRQFDVVVRGTFGGQPLLGVIECKDLGRKVGTPEVDAFVTKATDINANLKLLISRRGFSKPALDKCRHYGIQALSLLGFDNDKVRLFLGTRWQAEVVSWARVSVTLRFVNEPTEPVTFKADQLRLQGKKVIDWYTNYLIDHEPEDQATGWVAGIGVEFSTPQALELDADRCVLCRAIEFCAERVKNRYERMVGVSGTGFYDWNAAKAAFPPGSKITTEPVPLDFSDWKPVAELSDGPPGFMNLKLTAKALTFERVPDAIDLAVL